MFLLVIACAALLRRRWVIDQGAARTLTTAGLPRSLLFHKDSPACSLRRFGQGKSIRPPPVEPLSDRVGSHPAPLRPFRNCLGLAPESDISLPPSPCETVGDDETAGESYCLR